MIAAIQAKYPDGKPRCLGLGGVGIHVRVALNQTLYYPSIGPTSPLNHLFVLYAAPSADPVPELVADLARRGILAKVTVPATIDAETTGYGPPPNGGRVADGLGKWISHRITRFDVDVYQTRPFDGSFGYETNTSAQYLYSSTSFPSRLYDVPLPPFDTHYAIPTVEPYALSVVTSVCFPETPDHVVGVQLKPTLDGGQYMEADIVFDEHPADWMSGPAFIRAAVTPNTPSLTKPRLATIVLAMRNGQLTYARERM